LIARLFPQCNKKMLLRNSEAKKIRFRDRLIPSALILGMT